MKTISCWHDLVEYGIDRLTGEACGLSYRGLCDYTAQGLRILERLFCVKIQGEENWNNGTREKPHIGCILLPNDFLQPLAVFALLEAGCLEIWLMKGGDVCGLEPEYFQEYQAWRQANPDGVERILVPAGTAGERNIHEMSGRVT